MAKHDIVVIGGSAGSLSALQSVLSAFPAKLPASIFITIHLGESSVLPEILQRATPLKVSSPQNGEKMHAGNVYIAPTDHHLIPREDCIEVTKGPRENRHRPSIDVLFRNAARAFRSRVIGVVLSGALDDGVAGMYSIKAKGGLTVAQDPKDALIPELPHNVVKAMDVDAIAPAAKIGPLLAELVLNGNGKAGKVRAKSKAPETFSIPNERSKPAPFSCPECSGPMHEVDENGIIQFKCDVGHAYSALELSEAHSEALERALWVAIRTLNERMRIQEALAQGYGVNGDAKKARRFQETAESAARDLALLEEVLRRL